MIRAVLLSAALMFGEDAPKAAADPISDRLRFEIALLQRNYLDAQLRLEHAQSQLALKTTEAQKACATQDKTWHADTFSCQSAEVKP